MRHEIFFGFLFSNSHEMNTTMNLTALAIQPYQPADEDDVIRLWHACELTRPWNDPRKDIARKLTVQPELFLVGRVDGVIVATLMGGYDGHRAWINYLAVAPEHQQRGHARTLMDAVEQKLLALGCPKISLQVRTTNTAAMAFYRQLGYQQDEAISFGKRLVSDSPA
jgi:ribosomal protein S18 acetylase RimI-like enzyme